MFSSTLYICGVSWIRTGAAEVTQKSTVEVNIEHWLIFESNPVNGTIIPFAVEARNKDFVQRDESTNSETM